MDHSGTELVGYTLAGLVTLGGLIWFAIRKAVEQGVVKAVEQKFRQWEVRFTKLHERRVEVMEEVFDRLVLLKRALDAASGLQSLDDPAGLKHLQAATDAGNEAMRHFDARRYYLPREVSDKINEVLIEMKAAHVDMAMWAEHYTPDREPNTTWDAIGRKGREAVREKLPALIAEVEEAFRKLVEADG